MRNETPASAAIWEKTLTIYRHQHKAVKYYAAKWVWPNRNKACPVPQKDATGMKTVNWEKWFELKFKQTLLDYAEEIKKDGKPSAVLEMEAKKSTVK